MEDVRELLRTDVTLKVKTLDGKTKTFKGVNGWGYMEAHEGAHPAQWVIHQLTDNPEDESKRTHITADMVIWISVHVKGMVAMKERIEAQMAEQAESVDWDAVMDAAVRAEREDPQP